MDGIKVIKETSPDLVFLDIKFKDGIGFDIIKNTSGLDYRVIVISGHPNFGPEALTFSVLHYLNKPPELEIIKEAIKRFVDDREDRELKEEIRLFKENKSVTNDRILFRTKSGEKFYNYCDIVRFEANGSYTDIYFNLDKKVTVCESLKEISLKLNSNHFIRIHKSHITNVHYILDSDFGSLPNIILKNKKLLPIGKSFKDLLRKHILQN
ncbi:MAG: LytTR family DNA-binding domain-containing protein [Candidatus Kapabacteria bacterium]|nr:LytTR family DNA-binding domain-containing protein [Candidatus Kapabacteria bacterium]